MCNFEAVVQPDQKLKKMMTFILIIIFINFFSCFLRLFTKPSDMILDLFCVLFLYLGYKTIYFLYIAFYIVFSLLVSVILFIQSGTYFQMLIQGTLGDVRSKIYLILGVYLYLLVFYIFAVIYTFSAYKEMRAQLMENFGGGSRITSRINNRSEDQDEERPNAQSSQNNSSGRGFQAFSGRGIAVGG